MKSTASVVCLSLTITHCVVDGDDDDDAECLRCDLYFIVQFQVPPQVLSVLLWSALTQCVVGGGGDDDDDYDGDDDD